METKGNTDSRQSRERKYWTMILGYSPFGITDISWEISSLDSLKIVQRLNWCEDLWCHWHNSTESDDKNKNALTVSLLNPSYYVLSCPCIIVTKVFLSVSSYTYNLDHYCTNSWRCFIKSQLEIPWQSKERIAETFNKRIKLRNKIGRFMK